MQGDPGSGPGGADALWWLAVSAPVERAVALGLAACAALLVVLAWRARPQPATPLPPLSARAERRALAIVLVCAAVVRLAYYDVAWQPRWYFAQSTTLYASRVLAGGSLWREWLQWLGLTQVAFPHQSAVFFPVSIGVQALAGPSDDLPLVVGALWGMLTVLLAWACGRAIASPEVGVVFAAFVAGSPLEITWSRLGSLPIASAAQILLVVWLAHRAGRRGGVVLALLAGLVAWTSVYQHYNARVAIPLGGLALVVGLVQGRRGWRRGLVAVAAFAASLAAALLVVQRAGGQGLWPAYGGYVGNRGEGTLASALASAFESVMREGRTTIDVYFWNRRTGMVFDYWKLRANAASSTASTPGVASGGLVLVPIGLLGIVGLLIALRRPFRNVVWLALAAAGAALPVLSTPSSRRLLVFDLGWCAFAALGLLALVGVRPLARLSGRVRWGMVAAVPALAGAWSVFALVVLWRAMPWQAAPIPFGESGFYDGLTCLGCVDAGRRWRHDMAGGAVVMSFDTDIDRENPTSPGGLLAYPKIASVEIGHPERFHHFYSMLRNVEIEHPYVHQLFDGQRQDPIAVLTERIEAAKPSEIVWAFAQPTLWERTLAARLAAAGGTMSVPPMPPVGALFMMRPGGALEVRTPWEQRQAAFAVLREFVGPRPPAAAEGCARLSMAGKWTGPIQVLLLGDVGQRSARGLPEWLVGGWYEVRMQGSDAPLRQVHEAVAVARRAAGGFEVLAHWGPIVDGNTPASPPRMLPRPPGKTIGRACAAWAHDTWWLVDPVVSGLFAVPPPTWPLPRGEWIGVAALDDEHLALAGADQRVLVLDLRTGDTVASFPAVVPPSRNVHFGECTPVVATPAWIGIFDHMQSVLRLSAPDGRPLSATRIAPLLAVPTESIGAVGATPGFVGFGAAGIVATLAVQVPPGCPAGG